MSTGNTALWMKLNSSALCGADCGPGFNCWRPYLRPSFEALVEPLFCAPVGVDLNNLVACGNELFWLVIALGVISLISAVVGTGYGVHRLRVWRRHVQERAGLRQARRAPRVVTVNAPRGGDLISLASRRASVYDPLAEVPLINVPLNGPSTSRSHHSVNLQERV